MPQTTCTPRSRLIDACATRLQWAGKAEPTSFEAPTVSLHVHERIDPRTISEVMHGSHR